jgi:uncharacterized protein YndB with AHSA1/START domain
MSAAGGHAPPTDGYWLAVSTNTRVVNTPAERVWDILADGWLYPLWVVGATRMRDVDDAWPEVGSQLHHSAGVWPLVLDDTTEVVECDPGRLLRLKARGWPLGEAEVLITLTASGSATLVRIEEAAASGPGAAVPQRLLDPVLGWRNLESLRRLAFIAEGRRN